MLSNRLGGSDQALWEVVWEIRSKRNRTFTRIITFVCQQLKRGQWTRLILISFLADVASTASSKTFTVAVQLLQLSIK